MISSRNALRFAAQHHARMANAPESGRLGRAFTLIELLVVVAIIALLISVLLPSLSRAREQAKMVTCGNNLKQTGMGMTYYMEESEKGVLPPHAFKDVTTQAGGRGGTIVIEEYVVFTERLWQLEHVKDWRVYQCASDPWTRDAPAVEDIHKGQGTRGRSYSMNEQNFVGGNVGIEGQPDKSFAGQRVSDMKWASRTVVLNEWWRRDVGRVWGEDRGNPYWDAVGMHVQNLEIVHPNHLNKKANLLFADMHVEAVPWGVQVHTPQRPQGDTQLESWADTNGYPELQTTIIWDYRTN